MYVDVQQPRKAPLKKYRKKPKAPVKQTLD